MQFFVNPNHLYDIFFRCHLSLVSELRNMFAFFVAFNLVVHNENLDFFD